MAAAMKRGQREDRRVGLMRRSGRRAWAIGMVLVMIVLIVAACGGSDNDDKDEPSSSASAFPAYAGANELGQAVPPQDQLDNLNVELSSPGASLHMTDDEFEAVDTFYSETVKDDGWVVPLTSPVSDAATVSIMHRDKHIASVMVLKGSMAKMVETAITSQGLDFDASKISDDDVVILESHFTCDEADVQTCLDALTAATSS